VLSGVTDGAPRLRIVIGHWGELVLFSLERVEHLAGPAGLARTLTEYAREHVYVTPSGMLSERYLRWATEVLGPDRLLFATDYPFEAASGAGARAFLEGVSIPDADRAAIASGTWERLRAGIRR